MELLAISNLRGTKVRKMKLFLSTFKSFWTKYHANNDDDIEHLDY
jgi:hypothetical protein